MKLDKTVEPLATDTKCASARARRSASSTWSSRPARRSRPQAGRHDPARRTPPSRSSSTTSQHLRPPRRARDSRGALEGFGDAFAGRGRRSTPRSRRSTRSSPSLTPVMKNLADPDTELDDFFKQLGRDLGPGRAGGRVQARAVREHGRHLRGDQPLPARRCRQTIEKSPATLDTAIALASASSGRSSPTSPTCRAGCARPRRSCRARCRRINQRARGRHAGAAAHGRAERAPEGVFNALDRPGRQPEHAARAPRPAHHARVTQAR